MPTQRLLPMGKSTASSDKPAFTMRINGDLQHLLSRNSLRLKLIVKDGQMSLKAGTQIYPLDTTNEFTTLEVFKYLSHSTLKAVGSCTSRLQINTPISSPADATVTQAEPKKVVKSLTQAQIARRLIHILALGPITRSDLLKRGKLPESPELEALFATVAVLYDPKTDPVKEYPHPRAEHNETLYVLNPESYKDIKVADWKYSEREARIIKKNISALAPKEEPEELKPVKKEPTPKPVKKEVSPPLKKESVRKETPKADLSKPVKVKKEVSQSPERKETTTTKKRKASEDKDSYLYDLAQRFQEKYKDYSQLYKMVQEQKERDDQELKRLYELHKTLESWKKELWSSVAN